jgi:hypothetical protein
MGQGERSDGAPPSGSPMIRNANDVLALARRGVVIAVGGTVLLADAGGRLVRRAATVGNRQMKAWNQSVGRAQSRLFGRTERKP